MMQSMLQPVTLAAALMTLAGAPFATPAWAQADREACTITVEGESYGLGTCRVVSNHFRAEVRWADTGFLYLNTRSDGTASGTWTGPQGDTFATVDLPDLAFADGCWRAADTAICYASAAGDFAEAQARAEAGLSGGEIAALLLGLLALYLLPAILAFFRRHPNRWVILIVNALLGGTGIVWLGCLVWALRAVHISSDPRGTNGGESGLNLTANDIARVRIEPAAAPVGSPVTPTVPSASRPSLIAELRELAALKAQGVLNEAEFQRLKAELIEQGSGTAHWLARVQP